MMQTMETAEPLIIKWDPEASTEAKVTSLFYENREEALEFVQLVNKLHKAMHTLVVENSNSELLMRSQHLMQIAMKRLKKEFYQILSLNKVQLGTKSVSGLSDFVNESDGEVRAAERLITDDVEDAADKGVMTDLKAIADCMFSSDYGIECVKIYKVVRKSIVGEGIHKLGVENIKSSHVHKMDTKVLDLKIQNWLDASKVAVKMFNRERLLCDHVFASSSDLIRETCYSEITKEVALILFHLPENVAKNSKKSPELIFRMLDMYTTIAEQWPKINYMFSYPSTSCVVNQALNSLVKLGKSVRKQLTEFEKLLNKESLKTVKSDCGVHKFTVETMNYMSLLGDYKVLRDIILDSSPSKKFSVPETFFDGSSLNNSTSPLVSLWLVRLMFLTVCKLDGKAKNYKNVYEAYLFLANNLQHIISKVKSSKLRSLLGDDWIKKREMEVNKFAANYERVAWGQVIDTVTKNATVMTTAEAVSDCFKKINIVFEETHRKQLGIVIPNKKLRDEIKVSVERKLLPVYTEFYNAHSVEMRKDRRYAGVVKYAPEDIGNALSNLFFGSGSLSTLLSESQTLLSQ